jgi:hypothetical protein
MMQLHCVLATLFSLAAVSPALGSDSETLLQMMPRYISGGIGDEELASIRADAGLFSLRLLFAEEGTGAYKAEVTVIIESPDGQPVLKVNSAGPLLYTNLPAGRYKITARSNGQLLVREVSVAKHKAIDVTFHFRKSKNDSDEGDSKGSY